MNSDNRMSKLVNSVPAAFSQSDTYLTELIYQALNKKIIDNQIIGVFFFQNCFNCVKNIYLHLMTHLHLMRHLHILKNIQIGNMINNCVFVPVA